MHIPRLLNSVSALALFIGAGSYAVPAAATLITFDDLPASINPIPNGYNGLNWSNWDAFNGHNDPNSGYVPGIVSPNNVAFNAGGTPAVFSDSTFTFNSAYFTAAWRDNMTVTLVGKLNGTTIDTATFVPLSTAATLEVFNWSGINEVDLSTSGGTHHPAYTSGTGTQVAMDNLTINAPVPEPTTLSILGAGLAGLGLVRRRRRTA